jgi:hypothetical protein
MGQRQVVDAEHHTASLTGEAKTTSYLTYGLWFVVGFFIGTASYAYLNMAVPTEMVPLPWVAEYTR